MPEAGACRGYGRLPLGPLYGVQSGIEGCKRRFLDEHALLRKASETGIIVWNGDYLWGFDDYRLRSYSTVISAALVTPPSRHSELPVRLVEQEASVRTTATQCRTKQSRQPATIASIWSIWQSKKCREPVLERAQLCLPEHRPTVKQEASQVCS